MQLCKVLVFLLLLIRVNSKEPHCSKYDFEEKVLEKMVRMEFQMEILKSEMKETVNTVEKLKKEIKEATEEATETLVRTFEELQSLRDDVRTPTVAFKTRLDADIAVTSGQTIKFPVVLFNEGDAYNSETGKFTAPVNGTYIFSISFCLMNKKTLNAGIMVDSNTYSVTLFYGDANHECLAADTVAVMTAGQSVWIEALSASSTGTIVHQNQYRWNTFSGTLINKQI